MNPRKKKKIEELLRREVSTIILREMKDPRAGFCTVTRVELAEDQRSATVYVTVRGDQDDVETSLEALNRARGFVQGLIGKRLNLRWTPVLTFEEDTDIREALRLEQLIDQARREDRKYEP
jgi:ribosome-binding factor A